MTPATRHQRTRARRIRRTAVLSALVTLSAVLPWVAVNRIQNALHEPTTWLLTLAAAATIMTLVWCIDRAQG